MVNNIFEFVPVNTPLLCLKQCFSWFIRINYWLTTPLEPITLIAGIYDIGDPIHSNSECFIFHFNITTS